MWDDLEQQVATDSKSSCGRHGCNIGDLLRSLPDDAAETVARLLDNDAYTTVAIRRAVAARVGQVPAESTWRRHRNHECPCYRRSA